MFDLHMHTTVSDGTDTPEEILAGYKKNSWNVRYNTSWNKFLIRDIKEIASKYTEVPHICLAYKRYDFGKILLSFFGF